LVLGAASLLYWLIYRTAEMLLVKYVERTNEMVSGDRPALA
jgi:hypothetical protein